MRSISLIQFIYVSTIVLLCTSSVLGYSNNGYEIRDLEAKNQDDFAIDAQQWSGSKLVTPNVITSTCGSMPLVGGYNVLGTSGAYFSRIYTGLASHNEAYFTATFYVLDNWDVTQDSFVIKIDGVALKTFEFSKSDFPNTNACGTSSTDLVNVKIVGRVPHSKTTIGIQVVSYLSKASSQASFGLRDVSLLFKSIATQKTDMCANAPFHLSTCSCDCPDGDYLCDAGNCLTCDSACDSCYDSGCNNCYRCEEGFYFNGKDCLKCDSSCLTCSGPSSTQCKTCPSGSYLNLQTGQCQSSCLNPWQPSSCADTLKCDKPCPYGKYYSTDNQTCLNSCPAPMLQGTVNNVPICS